MSITIYQYEYKSIVKDFTIFAPVKHGTRWLQSTGPKKIMAIHNHIKDGKEITAPHALYNILFNGKTSPYQSSKIQLKKFKRELIVSNPVFVYRDPYEAFTKAILTGTHKSNNVKDSDLHNMWNGDPKKLNVSMTNNGHFSPTLWQEIYEVLEFLEPGEVTFVELRQLSDYIMINTLKHYDYKFNDFSFENDIVGDYTKDEIITMCKEYHPILWENFMIQIQKETIALNKLLDKFKFSLK
jgi:hypothetical protein